MTGSLDGGKPCADLLSVIVIQVGENIEGLAPCVPSLAGPAGGRVGVAQMHENVSLIEPVTKLPEHRNGLIEGGRSFSVAAQLMLDVANAVLSGRGAMDIAELVMDG